MALEAQDWERLAELVSAAGKRPGMFVGESDNVLAFNAFLTGMFVSASPTLLSEFKSYLEDRYGEGPLGGFQLIAWTKRQQYPAISERDLIVEIAKEASGFFRQKIEPVRFS